MKIMNDRNHESIHFLSMFLTPREAKEMRDGLNVLLKDPEAKEHFHVSSDDNSREFSCSIITETKLKDLGVYNKHERKLLEDK